MINSNWYFYLFPIGGAFVLSLLLSWLVQKLALKFNIVDRPDKPRKIHSRAVALLGGFSITFTVFIGLSWYWWQGVLLDGRITSNYLLGILVAGLILLVGGYLDDKYDLKPKWQIIFPVLAVLVMIASGLKITFVTNPLGGILTIGSGLVSAFIVFWWLLGMTYTTKILDGLDGLATGVSLIATIVLFFVSLEWDVPQSGTSILALLFAGSLIGFLILNFYPAKIFLGESGATFLGFMVGVLAIISGAKIATTLIVMGVPIIDLVWVIVQRLRQKQSPFKHADRKHLHYRLLEIGLSQRQTVLLLYLITLAFGTISLFLSTTGKIVTLGSVFVFITVLIVWLYRLHNKYEVT